MALKILLADDSMTAQNMGKKILTEAGYEVIAVSNGAAAVKKIAEHKPGLVVADVYMPGYSGLEVCERVKNAQETAKTPVILTVGKMEPFKAEDGQRVRADGLIVKPFEASDLLAAVKKIEQKLAMMAPPPPPETVKIAVPEEFKDESYEEWKVTADTEHPAVAGAAAVKFEVPQDMAAAPAFDMDSMMGSEPAPAPEVIPSFEASSVAQVEIAPVIPEPIPELIQESAPIASSEPLPDYKVMTVAEEMKLVETTRDPAFEATLMEAGSVPDLPSADLDPALVTDAADLQQFTTKFGVEGEVEPVVVGLASEMPGLYADAAPPAENPLEETQDVSAAAVQVLGRTGDTQDISDSADKVLEEPAPLQTAELPPAEMSSFELPADLAPPAEPETVLEIAPEPLAAVPGMDTQALQQFAEAVAEIPAEPAPAEPEPVLETAPEPIVPAPALEVPEAAPQVASIEQEMARAFAQVEAVVEEAAVPQAAAMAAAVGGAVQQSSGEAGLDSLDDETLGHIVSTVVERLKPELIAEIKRKLAGKK